MNNLLHPNNNYNLTAKKNKERKIHAIQVEILDTKNQTVKSISKQFYFPSE